MHSLNSSVRTQLAREGKTRAGESRIDMSGSCEGKSSWPELVGLNGKAATVIIMNENPKVNARTVKEGSRVSGDFRCDRVRVFIDGSHIVTQVPQIG